MNIQEVHIANKSSNLITLKSDNIEVTFLDLGATIYSLKTKDKNGKLENIVLQYQDIQEYSNNPSYFNATVGRVAGRIKDAKIILNNKIYDLEKNYQDKHTLHGGFNCLTHQQFDFEVISETKVKFTTIQKSSVDRFPRNVAISVTYKLLENSLVISFDAISDADTVLNMTNHCYYNLSGDYKTTIVDHELKVPAKKIVNVEGDLVPTEVLSLPEEIVLI